MKQIAGTAVMSIEDLKTLLFPIKKRTRNVKPLTIEQHEAMLERMKNMRKISLEARKRKKEKKAEMENNQIKNITEKPIIVAEPNFFDLSTKLVENKFNELENTYNIFYNMYNDNLNIISDQFYDLETKYNNLENRYNENLINKQIVNK